MTILIFEQLVKMFFIMLLAFLCYKIKLVSQEGNRSVSNLLLLVVNPCLILTVYQETEYDPELIRGLLLAFAAAATGTMMAIRYKQNYTYSSEIFALTTALAVFTIPAVVFLSELVL